MMSERYSRLVVLLWNPSKYQLRGDETYWSCGSTQATAKGDRFILVRTGRVNPGIVSFGWILSNPSTRPDAAYGNTQTTFVDIRPLTKISENPIVTRHQLRDLYPKKWRSFSPQAGGCAIKDSVVAEDIWERLCHEEKVEVANIVELSESDGVPKVISVTGNRFVRSSAVMEKAKELAKGRCQLCRRKGPFQVNGRYFLESHHIVPLAEGGKDAIDNVIGLCPNCHRKMHVLNDKSDRTRLLEKALKLLEKQHG